MRHQSRSSLPCPCLSCAFYVMFSWSQDSAKPSALDIFGCFGLLQSFHFSVEQQAQRLALKSTNCITNTCIAPSLNASCVSLAEFESTLESTFKTIQCTQQQQECPVMNSSPQPSHQVLPHSRTCSVRLCRGSHHLVPACSDVPETSFLLT